VLQIGAWPNGGRHGFVLKVVRQFAGQQEVTEDTQLILYDPNRQTKVHRTQLSRFMRAQRELGVQAP
jgi:hypothetical protein